MNDLGVEIDWFRDEGRARREAGRWAEAHNRTAYVDYSPRYPLAKNRGSLYVVWTYPTAAEMEDQGTPTFDLDAAFGQRRMGLKFEPPRLRNGYEQNAGRYYVWPLAIGKNTPLEGEGPFGPYALEQAKTFARIRATKGAHDYAVTKGSDPATLAVERVYQHGTGERLSPNGDLIDARERFGSKPRRYDPTWGPIPEVRWEGKIGEAGNVYQFNVKLTNLGPVNIDESDLDFERDQALENLSEELSEKYSWIDSVYLTGRSGGWLAVEDGQGEASSDQLLAISKLVSKRRDEFISSLQDTYGYREPEE